MKIKTYKRKTTTQRCYNSDILIEKERKIKNEQRIQLKYKHKKYEVRKRDRKKERKEQRRKEKQRQKTKVIGASQKTKRFSIKCFEQKF